MFDECFEFRVSLSQFGTLNRYMRSEFLEQERMSHFSGASCFWVGTLPRAPHVGSMLYRLCVVACHFLQASRIKFSIVQRALESLDRVVSDVVGAVFALAR